VKKKGPAKVKKGPNYPHTIEHQHYMSKISGKRRKQRIEHSISQKIREPLKLISKALQNAGQEVKRKKGQGKEKGTSALGGGKRGKKGTEIHRRAQLKRKSHSDGDGEKGG